MKISRRDRDVLISIGWMPYRFEIDSGMRHFNSKWVLKIKQGRMTIKNPYWKNLKVARSRDKVKTRAGCGIKKVYFESSIQGKPLRLRVKKNTLVIRLTVKISSIWRLSLMFLHYFDRWCLNLLLKFYSFFGWRLTPPETSLFASVPGGRFYFFRAEPPVTDTFSSLSVVNGLNQGPSTSPKGSQARGGGGGGGGVLLLVPLSYTFHRKLYPFHIPQERLLLNQDLTKLFAWVNPLNTFMNQQLGASVRDFLKEPLNT